MTAASGESPVPAPLQHGAAAGAARSPVEDLQRLERAVDPLAMMQRVADQALELIAAADGALVGLVIDSQSLRYVCGAGYLNDFVGEALLLQGSLSGQAIRSRQTLLTDDTELDQRVNRGATRAFDVRSSVCVPLGKTDGPIGVLNVSSRALQAFDEHDVALLSGLADFISTVIAAASEFMSITARLFNTPPSGGGGRQGDDTALAGRFVAGVLDPVGAARMESRGEIERVLSGGGFSIAVQPVFTFAGGEMFGVEALARFDGVNSPPPDVWLEKAHRAGLGVELELALVEAALEHLKELPPTAVLAVNAGPEALASERVAEVLAGVDASRIVVELTEHVKVEDYPHLAGAIGRLRATGVRLAIDDAGAGFASLMHILQLAPDFIKLDRALISGIDLDPVRRALLCSLLRFGEETGATLIAEGVETAAELMVLRDLGICHIQGFYLARPGPIADLPRTARRGSARVRRQARGPLRASERAGMRAAARA